MRSSSLHWVELHFILKLGAWFLLSIICLLSILCYLNFPLGYNQTVFHYMGAVMKDGGAPYRDFVDRKGPAGRLVYGLAAVLFGQSDFAYRVFDSLILAAMGVCLYKIARRVFLPLMAFGGVALWFSHSLLDGPGNTGDVTNVIVLGALVIAVLIETQSRFRLIAVGAIAAVMSWVKPTALLIVAPMLVYYLGWIKNENARWSWAKQLALVTFGFFVFSGVLIYYLYFTNALTYFYEAVVLEPLLSYVPKTQFILGHNLHGFSRWLLADPVFRIGGLIGLFWGKSKTKTFLIARLAVIGGFIAVFVESRFWPYHFMPVLPFLSIGILAGLQRLMGEITNEQKISRIKVGIVAGVFFLLLWPPLRLMAKDLRIIFSSEPNSKARAELFLLPDLAKMYHDRLELLQMLRPQLRSEDEVYVLGSDPGIYLALQKTTVCLHGNPGDLLYDYDKKNNPDFRRRWRAEILAFIEMRQPDWLVVDQNLWARMDTEAKQVIDRVVQNRYGNPLQVASYRLYHKTY
jgi:hypothetical protein